MAKIKIVCDSSAGLTDEEIKKYDITIIPLSVMIDGTVYVERETITKFQCLWFYVEFVDPLRLELCRWR